MRLNMAESEKKSLVVFQNKIIRRTLHNGEWFFSVVDVVRVLTDSPDAGAYWRKLKQRLSAEGSQVVTFCHELKLPAADGKKYKTDCANVKGLFRIIQSVPSPKAEPFKQWLAQVGYDRVLEIENPELAQDRTAEISKATFGMTPAAHKAYKGLDSPNQNLHLELIFTMLGERVTRELSRQEKPSAMPGHKSVARRGGRVAGNARKETEKELGHSIISGENHLHGNDLPGTGDDEKK